MNSSSRSKSRIKTNNKARFSIQAMRIADHPQMIKLWKSTEGMGITSSDSRANVNKYLNRNKGLSFVAVEGGKVVGTILCGHDGKRAFIYHLAVEKGYRRLGIGRKLAEHSLAGLKRLKLLKCTLFVYNDNIGGKKFWESQGWITRTDLTMMQFIF